MAGPAIALSAEGFGHAFPFHFVLDPELRVLQVGSTLARMLPELRVGQALLEHFRLLRPSLVAPSYAELRERRDAVVILRAHALPLKLRGQLIFQPSDDGEQRELGVFLGSPWITNELQLRELELSFKDFAVHDPLADMLVLLRAQHSALEESRALTAELRAQRERLKRTSEELANKVRELEAQRSLIEELSTPLIRVWREIVVMPLIGTLDAQRAEQALHTALSAVERGEARDVILDVTGAANFDSSSVSQLMRLAAALRLLGARCVLVGISPHLAMTLVASGVELEQLPTFSNLQAGLRHALARQRLGVGSDERRATSDERRRRTSTTST